MDSKIYTELRKQFTGYLVEKKLRKTEERYKILEHISSFPGHFDVTTLHEDIDKENFRISTATLYNTLELLIDANIVVKHYIGSQFIQYELRLFADTHQHLICVKCNSIREIKNQTLKSDIKNLKISRFTPGFYNLYIYGVCSKCTFKERQKKIKEKEKLKNQEKKNINNPYKKK